MGELIPGVKIFTDTKWTLGVDLGQSNDFTAISAIEAVRSTEVTWQGAEKPAGETFRVRHLQRLPLGLSYPEQISAVEALLRRPPLIDGCELVVDDTGAGRPVSDLLVARGLRPTRVTITAGDNQSSPGRDRWHVAKSLLISHLDARLHTNELKIAPDLQEAAALRDELRDFRRHVSAAGRYSYEARTGKHDDLVLSVAIALWSFVGRPKTPPARIGTYSQSGKPVQWR
jgi:hypothetical protein